MGRHLSLPKKRNPELSAPKAPTYEFLVNQRRLGQTNLTVTPANGSTTKPGLFNYAHLRGKLPESLAGSGIFDSISHPESYFLMRRSSDGYVSATGMFKLAFPWAKKEEEESERMYLRSLPETSPDESAGNAWIPPVQALELAEEYGMLLWIEALLDNAPIKPTSNDKSERKDIAAPPPFVDPRKPSPPASPARSRGRRSMSPSKIPQRKIASPRKPRTDLKKANADLQKALANSDESVTVEVNSAVETDGATETTRTQVKVELPAGIPEFPLPETTEQMIAKAKEMVAEAQKLEGASASKGTKRKAEPEDHEAVRTKKARILHEELQRQKVQKRALLGVSATLVLGAILPYFL